MKEAIFMQDTTFGTEQDLAEWVVSRCNTWRDFYESNYAERHEG